MNHFHALFTAQLDVAFGVMLGAQPNDFEGLVVVVVMTLGLRVSAHDAWKLCDASAANRVSKRDMGCASFWELFIIMPC